MENRKQVFPEQIERLYYPILILLCFIEQSFYGIVPVHTPNHT